MEQGWFYVNSGYSFRRIMGDPNLPDGSVEMAYHENTDPNSKLIAGTIFDPGTWASIVAGMSVHGDNNPYFQQALDFHNGKESI